MSKKTTAGETQVTQILERLKALEERIARLEGDSQAAAAMAADFAALVPTTPAPAESRPEAAPAPVREESSRRAEDVSEEILLVISAAVAAFLGERAHVRQVRLLHSDAWAQQGRVSVMASHRWAVHR